MSANDIVELVPYLLRFHPTDSLVLVGITDGTVAVTARVDLAEVNRTTMTELLDTLARRGRCTQAIAVSYTDDRCAAEGLPGVIDAAADADGVSMLDHLLVTGGHWISLACTDPDCCPPDGTPLHKAGHAAGPVAAAAVYAGLVAEPSRDAALACLDAPPAATRDAVAGFLALAEQEATQALLTGSIDRHRRSIIRSCYRAARTGEPLSDETAARVLVALWTYSVRDPLWLATDQGRLAGRDLWLELAHRAPATYAAPAWFLFAWATWRQGNSVLAREATDRALADDAGYSGAQSLMTALDAGINPHTLPKLRTPVGEQRS